MKLLLLHSPLTGPSIWRRLSALLRAEGHDVGVPDYRHALSESRPYYDRIAQEIARHTNEPTVLVVHSGAGALVPSIANAADGWITGAIFADALLPHPGKCWFDTVPSPLAVRLRGMAIGGQLPPWSRWLPKATLEAMLPDAVLRRDFAGELPSLPLGYFEEPAPNIPLAEKLRCAFLRLSPAYEAEALEAQRRRWPAQRCALHHLAMLTHPRDVTDELYRLIRAIA